MHRTHCLKAFNVLHLHLSETLAFLLKYTVAEITVVKHFYHGTLKSTGAKVYLAPVID